MKQMQVAEVKRHFREVLNAAERGESTIVLRHRKPVAVITPVENGVEERRPPLESRGHPWLALVGLAHDWDSMEQDMAEVVAERRKDFGRTLPPPFD